MFSLLARFNIIRITYFFLMELKVIHQVAEVKSQRGGGENLLYFRELKCSLCE